MSIRGATAFNESEVSCTRNSRDIGENVNEPYDLSVVAFRHLERPDYWRHKREAALDLVYGYREGAAKRAVEVLRDWSER